MTASAQLRIAVLADFDGPHARSWLRWFIDNGHDVHAISFYPPATPIDGATTHVLRDRAAAQAPAAASAPADPRGGRMRSLARLAHAMRYRRAGLARIVREIAPDVFHGHFVVEHGFYGAMAGAHPYVVTAWGSDVLVEPNRDPISRQIARWTLARADAITSNNAYMAERVVGLGAPREKVHVVTLGAERYDIERAADSVNRRDVAPDRLPVVLSTRAHEANYNIGDIIDAFAIVLRARPDARLVIAHSGTQTEALRQRARPLGDAVSFTGTLDRAALRDALTDAEVFVSVPSSDATSVALLQAMGAGALPVVSDLPAVREWVRDGDNGLVVPLHRPEALATAILRALDDAALRRSAAGVNLAFVNERGLNEVNMARMEQIYRSLAAGTSPGP